MKILNTKSGYGTKTVIAQLDEEDLLLDNEILVMMADGMTREAAIKRFNNKEHPGHFGFRNLRKTNEGKFTVTIYTD